MRHTLMMWATLGAAIVGVPSSAYADAATHELSLKVKTLAKTDCGGGSCVPACMIYATLKTTKFGPDKTAPLQVELWYKNKNVGGERRAVSLMFDPIRKGRSSETVADVPGHKCQEVRIRQVTVECPMERRDRCPSFYYVQIPKVSTIGLKAQKIEGK